MSYITPSTAITFYSGVPFDNTYQNTLWADNASARQAYFNKYKKFTEDNYTYQRQNLGEIRVGRPIEDLYDCNYLSFTNEKYENIVFYAFLTAVEYVNNSTTLVRYEIDVMQTWADTYDLKQCFVEREHSTTDTIGGNIVGEPIEVGDYNVDGYHELTLDTASGETTSLSDGFFVVVSSDLSDYPETGVVIGNVPAGLKYVGFSGNQAGAAGVFASINAAIGAYPISGSSIDQRNASIDTIVSIYVAPRCLCSGSLSSAGTILTNSNYVGADVLVSSQSAITGTEYFGNYQPKNKKLYTYPYNYYGVDNGCGGEMTLRYEFFSNRQPVFTFYGTFLPPASLSCVPKNYMTAGESETNNVHYGNNITITQYPQCAYAGDLYKSWVAQNSYPQMVRTATNVFGSIASGHPETAVSSVLGAVTDRMSQEYSAKTGANMVRGQVYNGAAAYNAGVQGFYGGRYHITGAQARIIDDFFTKFGYATNRVKVPNRSARPYWNYVKTQGCLVVGKMPADDIAQIERIYDSGVTFWKTGATVGDYSQDNSL